MLSPRNCLHCIVILLVLSYFLAADEEHVQLIRGKLTDLHTTKYQLSIRSRGPNNFVFGLGHLCSGALIARKAALTTAHCFIDAASESSQKVSFQPAEHFVVVMGHANKYVRGQNVIVSDISRIIYTPQPFDLQTYANDIALVVLAVEVPHGHDTVHPIPITDLDKEVNVRCRVTGWSANSTAPFSNELLSGTVPIIKKSICKIHTNHSSRRLTKGMICAGYYQVDGPAFCTEDSGSPLVCKGKLWGLASWNLGCDEVKRPIIFTLVAFHADWIRIELRRINIPLHEYTLRSDMSHADFCESTASLCLAMCFLILAVIGNP